MNSTSRWTSIDAYIDAALPDRRALLEELRATIHAAAPEAIETISYNMPAFTDHGTLVYFASLKHHVGFYPTAGGIAAFADELSRYACSKGAVRFPIDHPLPLDLIQRIVWFRLEENARAADKRRPAGARSDGR